MSARFVEIGGGRIIGPNGKVIIAINVSEMLISDSCRVCDAVIRALEAEFSEEANGRSRPN